jgi:hypothetical protein
MATGTRATNKATVKAAKAEHHRGGRILLPWLGAFLALPAVGFIARHVWSETTTQAATGVAAATTIVAAWTWHIARRARPDNPLLHAQAVTTVALAGAALSVTLIVGWQRPWTDIYAVTAATVVLTWNVRRLDVFRNDDTNTAGPGGVLGDLGVAVKSRKVISRTDERAEVELQLADGQTVEDVQAVARKIGSHAGTLRSGVTVVADPRREGRVRMSLEFKDVLEDTMPWPGPTNPAGSIADGIHLGRYRNGQPVWWYPAGNTARTAVPGHTAIGGMSGSGKGSSARVAITDLATRRDVVIIGSDTRKGLQFLGPVAPAVTWWAENPNAVKAQLRALDRAVQARNNALGRHNFESWDPRAFDHPDLRMPAIVYWMEEAAAVMDDVNNVVVELGEAARSAGVFLVFSAQRWSYDRISPSLRFNLSNVICYGVADDQSAGFLLTDSTKAAAPDPQEWKTRYPGRALAEFNGVDEALYPVPWKSYWSERDQALQTTAEWAPRMAALDPVTLEAFGDTYVKATKPQAATAVVAVPAQRQEDDDMQQWDAEVDGDDDTTVDITLTEAGLEELETMDDPELDAQLNTIDPRAPLPAFHGPDIDMRPEPDGRPKLSPEERRAAFAGMLSALMDAGHTDLSMSDLVDAWYGQVGEVQGNQRPFLTDQLNERIEQGQVERVGRGRYRLVALAEIAH